MKPNRGQTHFAGVTVSGSLAETVRGCRRWMHERYGCKSGHLTPPHVTLIPPFDIGEEKDCRKLEEARITSYNVCYTKLLRRYLGEQGPVSEGTESFHQGSEGLRLGREIV